MKKQLYYYLIGVVAVIILLAGVVMCIQQKTFSLPGGITIIIVSIASGLILPNPLSFAGLIVGIMMIVLPAKMMLILGIIFVALSIAIAIANLILWKLKFFNTQKVHGS